MTYIVNSLYRYVAAVMLAVGMMALTSCSDDSTSSSELVDDGPVRFSFTIVTKTVQPSRAADLTGDEIGAVAENFLDVDDVRCIIFDKEQKLVSDVTAKSTVKVKNDDFTLYELTAHLEEPFFVNSPTDLLDFYILVLANYSDWGINLPQLSEGADLSSFFNAADVTLTDLASNEALLNAATDSDERRFFPMAGLQHFVVNRLNLYNTTENIPYDLSNKQAGGKDINMLRALAKIEIVDCINIDLTSGKGFTEEDLSDPERISAVQLRGQFNQGSLLPSFNQWDRNSTLETQQVNDASVPASATYLFPPVLSAENVYTETTYARAGNSRGFVYDAVATARREDKCPVYSCYVFEYSQVIAEVQINDAGIPNAVQSPPFTRYPYVLIWTQGAEATEERPEIKPLRLPMRLVDFAVTPAPPVMSLMRNHIYRYEIVGIHQDIRVNWTVCPMSEATIDITYN